jgi:GMP synthase-like glutamine amidotransferase
VNVLSIVHGSDARAELFSDVVAGDGHALEEWSLAWGTPPPRPIETYGAVLVFGGAMHADQDEHHPWLRDEDEFLRHLLGLRVPTLGVCLGAQLLAKASDAAVRPADEPEIGWYDVVLTDAAADDPVFAELPERFAAFQWHHYTYDVPAAAVELARSRVCTQAFRLGESVWGVQFHPEVTAEQVGSWLASDGANEGVDVGAVAAETEQRIAGWNEFGSFLCRAFLAAAERAAPVPS